jgi:hypothetical protein
MLAFDGIRFAMLPSRWIFEHSGDMAIATMAVFPLVLALTILIMAGTAKK